MNRAEEDYIKAIYELSERISPNPYVTNSELCQWLRHSAQTVNEMVKKLEKAQYITYKRYKGSQLTEHGLLSAIKLIRRHRLWELFLVDKLDFEWQHVHEEAEQLEHVTSEMLEKKLYLFLGNPRFCPHGNPIPDLSGHIASRDLQPLQVAPIGKVCMVASVEDDPELLVYLNQLNISLQSTLTVTQFDPYGEIVHLETETGCMPISFKIAEKIYVKIIEEV
ncbi:metal-dependent transcriptional regulator [Fusibacter sp. JL298sf-3]